MSIKNNESKKFIYANRGITYTESEMKLDSIIDNYRFSLPKDTDELVAAGKTLHNMLEMTTMKNSYHEQAIAKEIIIMPIYKDDVVICCLEIKAWAITMAKVLHNGIPDKELANLIVGWAENHGLSINTKDLKKATKKKPKEKLS